MQGLQSMRLLATFSLAFIAFITPAVAHGEDLSESLFCVFFELDDENGITRLGVPDGSDFAHVTVVKNALEHLGIKNFLMFLPEKGYSPKITHLSTERFFGIRFVGSTAEIYCDGNLGFGVCSILSKSLLSNECIRKVVLKTTHGRLDKGSHSDP